MAAQPHSIQLRIPEQDLRYLTLGSNNPKKLQAWVDSLPMMNLGETARQLYQLIQELNRLELDAKARFQLLEIIRPPIDFVCSSLGKHYLNQPVVLPEKARKIANLAQALQSHLATGYKIVVVHGVRKMRDKELARNVTVAIHRAISELTKTLVRCYQLYYPTPKYLWLEIHQLYLLAEHHKVHQTEVTDKEFKHIESCTIAEAYSRALLLATCKPNQLRQKEIDLIYDASEEWCGYVSVKQAEDADLFVFNLQADAPPTYRTLANKETSAFHRYIGANQLARLLSQSSPGAPAEDLYLPKSITPSLIQHLALAWGALAERSFNRTPANGKIHVCLGLGAMHFFVSDGVSFEVQLAGGQKSALAVASEKPFANATSKALYASDEMDVNDVWSNAFDGGGHKMADDISLDALKTEKIDQQLADETQNRESAKYDSYSCDMVNSSPGGYCIQWTGDVPSQMRTGEIVGVREQGQHNWSVAVIRWVKQLANKGAQMGVELLAPKALPCGCRVIKKTGELTEYMRTLMLPELRAIGQPATLITPNIAFNVGYKVILNQQGEETRATLTKLVSSTASFSQFQFKEQKPAGAQTEDDSKPQDNKDDFDSIWSSL